jgi:hypothetical protein
LQFRRGGIRGKIGLSTQRYASGLGFCISTLFKKAFFLSFEEGTSMSILGEKDAKADT